MNFKRTGSYKEINTHRARKFRSVAKALIAVGFQTMEYYTTRTRDNFGWTEDQEMVFQMGDKKYLPVNIKQDSGFITWIRLAEVQYE